MKASDADFIFGSGNFVLPLCQYRDLSENKLAVRQVLHFLKKRLSHPGSITRLS